MPNLNNLSAFEPLYLLPLREDECYYYHSDHLGSTSYISDTQGNATQFVCYMPFGEAFVDEHNTRPGMPYKFNGKNRFVIWARIPVGVR